MKVKLCGFTEKNSMQTAINCKVDFLGFVFCNKSPRNISFDDASNLAKIIPTTIAKVAVVVEPSLELLQNINLALQPQYFQIHGNVDLENILTIKRNFPEIKIIKAFTINKEADLQQTVDFIDEVDIILFDSSSGGSGKPFNFKILQNFSCKKDWFLSGGININNIDEALKITGAKMIDLSSGIEKERGKKSSELITEFMHKIKNAD